MRSAPICDVTACQYPIDRSRSEMSRASSVHKLLKGKTPRVISLRASVLEAEVCTITGLNEKPATIKGGKYALDTIENEN